MARRFFGPRSLGLRNAAHAGSRSKRRQLHVPACHFYAAQGCTLGSIDRFAYADLPDEAQLLWYKKLTDDDVPAEQ